MSNLFEKRYTSTNLTTKERFEELNKDNSKETINFVFEKNAVCKIDDIKTHVNYINELFDVLMIEIGEYLDEPYLERIQNLIKLKKEENIKNSGDFS